MPPAAEIVPEYIYLGLNCATGVAPTGENIFSATERASAPLILIMATPPGACAVDMAAMQSLFIIFQPYIN